LNIYVLLFHYVLDTRLNSMLNRFRFFWFTIILESLDNNCELRSNPSQVLEISIVDLIAKNDVLIDLIIDFPNLNSFSTCFDSTSPCRIATTWAIEDCFSPSFNKHKRVMFNSCRAWIISSLHKWSVWSTMSIKLPSLCSVQAYINTFLGHFFI